MTTLRAAISQLANQFASGVLEAIRGASLAEILAESAEGGGRAAGGARRGRPPAAASAAGAASRPAKRRRGRLERRSATDIAGVVRQIVDLLGAHPAGLRAEQIRHELGLEAKELPRPITEALASRKISKQGQKRATTYFAKGAKAGGATAAKRGAKAGKAAGKTAGKKRGKRSSSKKRGAKKAAGATSSHTNGASASA
jgi:hypothetical protein